MCCYMYRELPREFLIFQAIPILCNFQVVLNLQFKHWALRKSVISLIRKYIITQTLQTVNIRIRKFALIVQVYATSKSQSQKINIYLIVIPIILNTKNKYICPLLCAKHSLMHFPCLSPCLS